MREGDHEYSIRSVAGGGPTGPVIEDHPSWGDAVERDLSYSSHNFSPICSKENTSRTAASPASATRRRPASSGVVQKHRPEPRRNGRRIRPVDNAPQFLLLDERPQLHLTGDDDGQPRRHRLQHRHAEILLVERQRERPPLAKHLLFSVRRRAPRRGLGRFSAVRRPWSAVIETV